MRLVTTATDGLPDRRGSCALADPQGPDPRGRALKRSLIF